MDSAASTAAARAFIEALYAQDEHVAVLAVQRGEEKRGEENEVHQRITPAASAAAGRFQSWLRHLNARGHDIFIGMNPIRAGTKGKIQSRRRPGPPSPA